MKRKVLMVSLSSVVRLVRRLRANRARGRLGAMVFTDGYRQACEDLLVKLEEMRKGKL